MEVSAPPSKQLPKATISVGLMNGLDHCSQCLAGSSVSRASPAMRLTEVVASSGKLGGAANDEG